MIKITLKDNVIKEFDCNVTVAEVAKSIGMGIYKSACAGMLNGEVVDLRTEINSDSKLSILTFDDNDGKKAYWHTTAHIMAQAVNRLFKNVKFAIGPAIDNGFYYDFDMDNTITQEDLLKIEAEMKKIIKENIPIERVEMSTDDAIKLMQEQNQNYKIELIKEHSENGEDISFYRQGDFIDLCKGPHLMSTGNIKSFKLLSCTGAYWRGNAKGKMLQRIYGISFPKSSMLNEYIEALEEAKKRDHNKIGRELDYFTTVPYIGQGLPVMMPNGSKVIQILQRFVEDEEERRGYILTKTPFLAKSDMYKISGHWDHYRDSMFILGDPEKSDTEEVFALRPMTCPFQFQVYLAKSRSYRDLPMRLNETSTLFRNESSGEMHGLIRLRQFTISEGHLACTPEQLEDEFAGCLDLAKFMLEALGLENDVSYRFSKWDENDREKYIGEPEAWENIQNKMRDILNDLKIDYTEANGEAAFYGPKLDIQIKNVFGKEDTLITIQIDFQLAERFGMTYIDKDGKKKYPYVIHRTSLGCYERTLALLIEKYAGALPLWLMPEQIRILPISDKFKNQALELQTKLKNLGCRVTTDLRSEKTGYKIREARLQKIPYMIIIGEKEIENNTISVRKRGEGDLGSMTFDEFILKFNEQLKSKK